MVQVRGYTEDDVDVLADEFAGIIEGSLRRAVQSGANTLRSAITAASSAGLQPENVAIVTQTWQDEVDGVLTPYIGEVYTGSATSVAVGLAEGFPSQELAGIPLIADEFQLAYVKSVQNIFQGIGDDVWEDVRAVLVAGVKNGESIEQIAAKMMQVTEFTKNHATMVARTSVHSAAESGSIAQLRWMGYEDNEVEKEWLATHDGRTRPTHWHADKQKVPLSGKFTVGGSKLDFPGDPLGAFDEIVHCRCTALFNIDTPPKFRCDGLTAAAQQGATDCVMPVPDADISGFDDEFKDSIVAAFMSHKISPAWGGAKIHKVIQDVRDASYAGDFGFSQPVADVVSPAQILKVIDEAFPGKYKKSFSESYWEWLQSPAGKKATAGAPKAVTHVVAPIKIEPPSPFPPTPAVEIKPGVWSAPTGKFKVLDDPGVSGDGYAAGGQWGKFGAAGVLVRAKDEAGVYRYLLIQRNGDFDKYEAWKWQLPGGALDELEGPYEGAAREFVEELGVDKSLVEGLTPSGEMTYTGPGAWHYTTISADAPKTFSVDIGTARRTIDSKGREVIVPPELSDAQWFTAEEIAQMVKDGKIVKHLDNQIDTQISSIGTPFKGKPDYIASFEAPTEIASLDTVSTVAQQIITGFYKEKFKLPVDATGPEIYATLEQLAAYINDPAKASWMPEYVKNVSYLQYLRIMDKYDPATDFEHTLLKYLQTTEAKKTIYKKGFPKSLVVTKKELPPLPPKPVAPIAPTTVPQVDPLEMLAQAVSGQIKPIAPTAPVTPLATTGDISSFDYFFKQDVLDKWIELGAGKKVTPAWGGAKIWKLLGDLRTQVEADVIKSGMTAADAPNELQLLRMLDDAGGFVGKPKTYEGELLKWLDSPAGKKAVPKPPLSLTKPKVTPVLKPTAVADTIAQDEVATALAPGTPNKISINTIFVDLPKYQGKETIAYITTANGDTLKVVKESSHFVQVWVRKDSLGKTAWTYDKAFDDWSSIVAEYNIKAFDTWSQVPPKPLLTTKIAGKAPGDIVTLSEIEQSRYLWETDDVIATTQYQGHDYQLVAAGNGTVRLDFKLTFSTKWITYKTYAADAKIAVKTTIKGDWKLTGDVIETKTASTIIDGASPGDVLTPARILSISGKMDMPVAYAQDNAYTYSITYTKFGDWEIKTKTPSGAWTYHSTIYDEHDFGHLTKWYLAKNDGSMPAQFAAGVPGKTVPGAVTQSKFTGVAVSEKLPSKTLIIEQYDKFNDLEIIAYGKSTTTDMEFRLYKLDTHIVIEFKEPGGAWKLDHIILDPTPNKVALTLPGAEWYATADKASAVSLQVKTAKSTVKTLKPIKVAAAKKTAKKAAKKTAQPIVTPKPVQKKYFAGSETPTGYTKGTEIAHTDAIFGLAGSQELHDGQIIAYGTYHSWQGDTEYRVAFIKGHLIQQKKSKAGSWIGTKVIGSKWDIPYIGKGQQWIATNDFMSAPNIKAATKFVEKHLTPKPAFAPAAYSPPVTTAPGKVAPAAPFQMRHVDLSPWNDTEREEIYKYLKSQGIYVSSPPEQIWGAVQGIKAHFQTKYKGKYLDLNEVEILRIADERGAIKFGVTDTHPFESKVVNWLKTPGGKAWVNKRIDAPIAAVDIPAPMSAIDTSGVSLEQQRYTYVTAAESLKNRQESHAKYGGWKGNQKSALRTYTSGQYSAWNAAIRRGELGTYRQSILDAQAGMRPSVRPMVLHRRVGFPELNDPSIVSYETLLPYVGRTYINRGFNSTSFGTKGTWSGPLHIEIECPIGTPMSHAADYSHYPGENEVTLATHLIYQILSVTKESSGTTLMRVRVIGVAQP